MASCRVAEQASCVARAGGGRRFDRVYATIVEQTLGKASGSQRSISNM
jgi:hypothetical protein